MNQINRTNIQPFIAQLYRERKSSEAPAALLNSWVNLTEEEIEQNLSGLFESWGMGPQERSTAISRFVKSQQNQYTQATATTAFSQESAAGQYDNPAANPKKKNSLGLWIALLLVVGVGGFFAYKYVQYIGMGRVYAITENIVIRDQEGKSVGRMDLYQKDKAYGNSYTNLRTVDKEVHFKQPEGSDKEYPTRMVLMDSIGFLDFIFKKDKVASFVNVNYIVNDKAEYELYQSAFKEVATVAADNAKLTVIYRKVIVGAMAKTKGTQDKYVVTNKGNLPLSALKNTESILVFEKQKGSEYVVIASLNDGNYYQFEGDINTNVFKPLQLINVYDEYNVATNLTGSYRFTKTGDKWRLYNVAERNTTNYELSVRNDGADYDFIYIAPPVVEPIVDSEAAVFPPIQ